MAGVYHQVVAQVEQIFAPVSGNCNGLLNFMKSVKNCLDKPNLTSSPNEIE